MSSLRNTRRRWTRSAARGGIASAACLLSMLLVATSGLAGTGQRPGGSILQRNTMQSMTRSEEGLDEITEAATQYGAVATAPAQTVDSAAFSAAAAAAAKLPKVSGSWKEVTNQPYDQDDPRYRDPYASNSSAGWGFVTGRIAALAVDPADPTTVYAGAAGGGVWKTTDGGQHWAPIFDDAVPTIAIGAIAINPADGSVWVGTGENNTAFENYTGSGIYRSGNGGASWHRIGGASAANSTVGQITFDRAGNVYAATSRGLLRRSVSDPASTPWSDVLDAPSQGYQAIPYGLSIVNSVVVQPGTKSHVVVANMAWRNGAAYDGFYVSTDRGRTFSKVTVSGDLAPNRLGRATLAYAADGSKLYAVVEDPIKLIAPDPSRGNTALAGVFVSESGNPAGPWTIIANWAKLARSGSALDPASGYGPGVQAWYNQFIGVDPADPDHVYVGLEEVFETTDGGTTWHAIGPYWNFSFPCWHSYADTSCPPTTHPDQHAVAFGGGMVYVGNDGGVWSRALDQSAGSPRGWNNTNATMHALQYYYAGVGDVRAGNGHRAGQAIWGGMQDNGVSLAAPGLGAMVSPFGGDGGDTIVDPTNGDNAVVEYTDLDMWLTTNGGYAPLGRSFAFREMTPSCFAYLYTPKPCDPNPRFIAPFRADVANPDHWVAGGQYVWDNGGAGWSTSCSGTVCDWTPVRNTGAGHSVTAIAVNGDVTYAGWCGPSGCNPSVLSDEGAGFQTGIDTNYGGTWHRLKIHAAKLPNRYVSAVAVDPADPAHVWAAFGGFSRRWIEAGGTGHVFESHDGGGTWADISGNLPDAPARDLVLEHGNLLLATDVGVFTAKATHPGAWSTLGAGLPHAGVDDLTLDPNGRYVLAATHGRGLWKVGLP